MEQTEIKQQARGLSGTALKMIALGCMVFDHIHYFFGFTGMIPEWFSMLGRLSAPLFLFCVVEGFSHTRNRKKYFLKVYAISIAMNALLFFMQYVGLLVRPDGFYPMNGVMTAFTVLMVIWQGMDWLAQKRYAIGLVAVALPLAWPILITLTASQFPGLVNILGFSAYTIVPMWNSNLDCGLPTIISGILLYLFRKRRKLQAAVFAAFTFLYFFVFVGCMVSQLPGFVWSQMFTNYYEWYGMFAGILMLCYNGQRGRGYQKLFYIFYPAHIYLLYALSWGLYLLMN